MKKPLALAFILAASAGAAIAAADQAAAPVSSSAPPVTASTSVTANGVTTTTTTTTASTAATTPNASAPAATTTTTTTTTTAEARPAQAGSGLTKEETDIGEAALKETCVLCHDATIIQGAGKTREEWQITVERMISDKGAPLDPKLAAPLAKYLATHYGPR